MYVVSGTFRESPQRTHHWNNLHLDPADVKQMREEDMVFTFGDDNAKERGVVHFHLPILGGWKEYIVLQEHAHGEPWHVGWITEDKNGNPRVGVSRIPIRGPLRVLRGDMPCKFFGICGTTSLQIHISQLGAGRVKGGDLWRKLPLL
jgi:hypothetical protein